MTVTHDDGRVCSLCRRWMGNPRDGVTVLDWWFPGEGGWRFCDRAHDMSDQPPLF